MNIYAGNLSRDVTEDDLRQAFEAFGQVESATLIKDRFTGEPRGFGFIEMPSKDEAQTAISQMNGKNLRGQAIKVSEAQARKEDSRGGEGRPRQGGGGGGGRRRF
jgi:RNA recognition motif-containing protein